MIISQKQINKQFKEDLINLFLYFMIYVLFTFNIHLFIMKYPSLKEAYEQSHSHWIG
jgi:hypothetical protein